tara:strand:+ start:201 stop:398 length:198 start_codon:yes stop_codon:yes gene_type:complete
MIYSIETLTDVIAALRRCEDVIASLAGYEPDDIVALALDEALEHVADSQVLAIRARTQLNSRSTE